MIKFIEIKNILDFISNTLYEQVKNGTQTRTIPESFNASACGQFIVEGKKQRGIHGTSSAIRVLGGTENDKYYNTLNKLINYLLHRNEIDSQEKEISQTNNFRKDSQNVIKISEQLYSLYYVPGGITNASTLINELLNELLDCYKNRNEKGWAYFLNDKSEKCELLPTCFAVMAINLHSDCSQISEGIKLIIGELEKFYEKAESVSDPASFSILVFALYVITFKLKESTRDNLISESKLKIILDKLWKSEFCTLDTHIEQDIDYWSIDDDNFNIRIHWQLYLIALSSHLNSFKFSSVKTQRLLKTIVYKINTTKEFKYPYSGNHMSARTLAVLFETLKETSKYYKENFIYKTLNFYDKVVYILRIRWVLQIFLLILLSAITFFWYKATNDFKTLLKYIVIHYIVIIFAQVFSGGKSKHH
jgi:hypothetical protein